MLIEKTGSNIAQNPIKTIYNINRRSENLQSIYSQIRIMNKNIKDFDSNVQNIYKESRKKEGNAEDIAKERELIEHEKRGFARAERKRKISN